MNLRRLYAPTVLGLLSCGGLAYFAASRSWATVRVSSQGLPADVVSATGADAIAAVPALALVIIASCLAVLAASHRIRKALGIAIVVVAVVGLWLVVAGQASIDAAVNQAVRESPAFTGDVPALVHTSPWRYVTAAAFMVAAVCGVLTAWWARAWPTMSGRYDAPSASPRAPDPDSGADIWKALDQGTDPTQ